MVGLLILVEKINEKLKLKFHLLRQPTNKKLIEFLHGLCQHQSNLNYRAIKIGFKKDICVNH